MTTPWWSIEAAAAKVLAMVASASAAACRRPRSLALAARQQHQRHREDPEILLLLPACGWWCGDGGIGVCEDFKDGIGVRVTADVKQGSPRSLRG